MPAIDALGVIAIDGDIQAEQIFVNSMKTLQYTVKPKSELPDQWGEKSYTGYWTNGKYDFEDQDHMDDFSRRKNFSEWMKNQLIVFKPSYRNGYYKMDDIRIVRKPNKYTDKSTYSAFPIFSEKTHGMSKDEFKEKLLLNKFIGQIENISHEDNDTPEFIIWKENEYDYKIFGPFEKHQYAYGGFAFYPKGELKEIIFKDEWFEDVVNIPNTETLIFIGIGTQQDISQAMDEAEAINRDVNQVDIVNAENTDRCGQKNYEDNLEEVFIDRFIKETHRNRFVYASEDLVNFHTAMKVSNLVILAGMSGTGKSRLIDFYKKALSMPDERVSIIPVRSSWTDDADLIGYVDLMHMVYRPADSGLVNILLKASVERDQLFIICFDEMNLARVEHYFSQLLSLMEMDPNRRYLQLYNEELEMRLYNGGRNEGQYPPAIKISENVMFVGTVNMDESTYHFSDKVLDRANVISLSVRDFSELKMIEEPQKENKEIAITFSEYLKFKEKSTDILLSDQEIKLLQELHTTLQMVNKNIGVGFRILNQIDLYLKNIPVQKYFSRKEAFDKQIVQRILTKVRGSEDQLKGLLGRYNENTDEVIDGKLLTMFEQYSEISDFYETKKIIRYKAKELKMYGYTI